MAGFQVVLGFDMETDIGSWTPWYNGFAPGTEAILRVLKHHGVTGTFFFTADAAEKNPEVLRKVRDAGHEIGAHTLFHETIGDSLFEIPGMMPILPGEVKNRLRLNTEKVEAVAGIRPSSFRCPRLFGSTAVVNALEELGYKADATYPLYFYRKQLRPYHPNRESWLEKGDMKIIEIPNFADLSMKSNDPYGRDLDQWPLWRLEGAEALMKHVHGYMEFCRREKTDPFICTYMHPWEFHEMPKGLLHYGEGAVLPDEFIVRNCGPYAEEQLDLWIGMLKAEGAEFRQAQNVAID